jgi:hypothetical protein
MAAAMPFTVRYSISLMGRRLIDAARQSSTTQAFVSNQRASFVTVSFSWPNNSLFHSSP